MNRLRLAAVSTVFALLAFAASAQERLELETFTTPAGHEVHYIALPDAPYSELLFSWPNGASVAVSGREGIHMLAPALLFERAGERDLPQIREAMEDAGQGVIVANTFDATNLVLTTQGETFEPAASIAADAIERAALDPDDLSRLQRNIADNLKASERDPQTVLLRAMGAFVAGGDQRLAALTNRPTSTFEDVTSDDIRVWAEQVFTGTPQILAAGAADREAIAAAVDAVLADRPDAGASLPSPAAVTIERAGQTLAVELSDAPVALVSFVMEGPDRSWGRGAALQALVGGPEARLFRSLRSTLGATYGLQRSDIVLPTYRKLTTIGGTVAPDMVSEVIDTVHREIETLRRDGITQAEFDAYREGFRIQIDRTERDPDTLVGLMRDDLQTGRTLDLERDRRELEALTLEGINREITQVLPERMTTIVALPDPSVVEADCMVTVPEDAAACPK